jgi:hypothetical protein
MDKRRIEQLLEAMVDSLDRKAKIRQEVDREMSKFSTTEFSAVYKGVTAHCYEKSVRLEISEEAYSNGREFLEEAITIAVQRAHDIQAAELQRLVKQLDNRFKEFRG